MRRRQEIAARQSLARQILGGHVSVFARPESIHLWLTLPEPWRAEQFVTQARARGVLVASPELFAVGRTAVAHAVRVSLGFVADRAELEAGLRVLADMLENPRRAAGPAGI
jgi:DNA-binding transcriptional MocR family regulator